MRKSERTDGGEGTGTGTGRGWVRGRGAAAELGQGRTLHGAQKPQRNLRGGAGHQALINRLEHVLRVGPRAAGSAAHENWAGRQAVSQSVSSGSSVSEQASRQAGRQAGTGRLLRECSVLGCLVLLCSSAPPSPAAALAVHVQRGIGPGLGCVGHRGWLGPKSWPGCLACSRRRGLRTTGVDRMVKRRLAERVSARASGRAGRTAQT